MKIALCTLLLAAPLLAHPGSGIAVDPNGTVYFVDMVSGIWKLAASGKLTHIKGPGFHWMALDERGRFANTELPSGRGGEVTQLGPVILASDYPVAMGKDGNLYYPSHDGRVPMEIKKIAPSGDISIAANVRGPTDLNGLAIGPDNSIYYTEDNAIRHVAQDGRIRTITDNVSPQKCASNPVLRGLEVAADGTIYVAAAGCASVLEVSRDGHVATLYQAEAPWSPTGIALSGNDVYVLEFTGVASDDRRAMIPRVRKISADGTTRVIATVSRH